MVVCRHCAHHGVASCIDEGFPESIPVIDGRGDCSIVGLGACDDELVSEVRCPLARGGSRDLSEHVSRVHQSIKIIHGECDCGWQYCEVELAGCSVMVISRGGVDNPVASS